MTTMLPAIMGVLTLGPVQFDRPVWLLLAPAGWLLTLWIARRSLSGLAGTSRRVALALRLLVIGLVTASMAEPAWRRESRQVAVTVIRDASRSVPAPIQRSIDAYLDRALERPGPDDLLALVTIARDAYVQALPHRPTATPEVQHIGATDGTDLEGGVRLAMAVRPESAANRLLLVSDGNETAGSLLAAAAQAQAAGVPIDVLPLRYRHEREVMLERVAVPGSARVGQPAALRAVLRSTRPATGRLTVTVNGEALDLDPGSPALGAPVRLEAGVTPVTVQIVLSEQGPQEFRAVFTPDDRDSDTLSENNAGEAVTFVAGEGRVLVVAPGPEEAAPFARALAESNIRADVRSPGEAWRTRAGLFGYDAVALLNVASFELSLEQQQELRSYVHDLGGGLLMLGGPNSFGAGGWIGSPVADVLPVKLDPPQKRQMPRGALALIMHSCEMPDGNYWGQRTAEVAVDALSRQDVAGVMEYSFAGGEGWVHELAPVGDKSEIRRAIKRLTFGDAPSFANFMRLALDGLRTVDAGQKHCIIISDGDPSPPSDALLEEFVDARISVSCVAVFPHSAGDPATMRRIADITGGSFHSITQNNQLQSLPQIFIKEAKTVRRSLIWEGQPFAPTPTGVPSEPLRGVGTPLPAIGGYVVTGEREGLSLVTLRGQENDPLLAQWQYGLGRAVAFTSDATTRWAASWTSWAQFRSFWEQHVRWVMRPASSPNMRLTTEQDGETTRVVVEAFDDQGERLNFLRWRGRVARPDLGTAPLDLRQVAPGRYEGSFPSADPGSYTFELQHESAADPATGVTTRGSLVGAVSRPFASEYRALRDNTPLLEQVAAMTGGRVLPEDPAIADLWEAGDLRPPVALTAVHLIAALAATGLFLLDVAVRRVRIDVRAPIRLARAALSRAGTATGAELSTLKEARERARERLAEPARRRPAGPDRETVAEPGPPPVQGASVKFEATRDELRRAATARAGDTVAGPAPPAPPGPQSAPPARQDQPGPGDEASLSRLMKAKRRAREDLDDRTQPPPGA